MLLIICNSFWIQDCSASDYDNDDINAELLKDVDNIVHEM